MQTVTVNVETLKSCLTHVAWGVFCSSNTRLPDWLSEEQGKRISEFFKLIGSGNNRALEYMDEVATHHLANNPTWAEPSLTWQQLRQAIEQSRVLQTNFANDPICPVCNESMEERWLFDERDLEGLPPGECICTDCKEVAQKIDNKWLLAEVTDEP